MKNLLFFTSIFAGLMAFNALADASAPTRCQFGCDTQPQCETLAKATEIEYFGSSDSFELWGIDTITANPNQPAPYQIETYGVAGTASSPGHTIYITYGFKDSKNPDGACRVEMVDTKCVSCGQ